MKNTGDGRRVSRAEKEVQETIAKYLISGFRSKLPGIVTVSRVIMPPDLKSAKVYITIMATDNESAKLLEAVELLQEGAAEVQHQLGKQLAMRYTPKLTFFADRSVEKVIRVDSLLKEIEQNRKPSE